MPSTPDNANRRLEARGAFSSNRPRPAPNRAGETSPVLHRRGRSVSLHSAATMTTRFIITSDLHQSIGKWRDLVRVVEQEKPRFGLACSVSWKRKVGWKGELV